MAEKYCIWMDADVRSSSVTALRLLAIRPGHDESATKHQARRELERKLQ